MDPKLRTLLKKTMYKVRIQLIFVNSLQVQNKKPSNLFGFSGNMININIKKEF